MTGQYVGFFRRTFVVSMLLAGLLAAAEEFSNPIIPGYAPDPSVVRVGDDYYLTNSTFEYFPGLPIYHSRDLVNWRLIGHALHRESQIDLDTADSSGGVHAPTIRYHDGTFYVIVTNIVDNKPVNLIVTATDPAGPWSDPHILEDAPGIDPSLLFDDDGRVWYTGNWRPPDPEFEGQAEIWLQELDLDAMQLVGDKHYLWRGCCQGAHAEGPHLYKKDGYYYLLISEGGTGFEHAISVAISRSPTGPYQNNPRNPVLTHRHLSYDYPISGVGHADLVETQDGRWFAVALGWRLIDGAHGILGRETFLAPVIWEREPYAWKKERFTFPVVAPRTGRIELRNPMPLPDTRQQLDTTIDDEFDASELAANWNLRRTHDEPFHSLTDNPGHLRLHASNGFISPRSRYSFVGTRQRDFEYVAETSMRFQPTTSDDEAGLVLMQNDRSAILMTMRGGQLSLRRHLSGEETILAAAAVESRQVELRVRGDYLSLDFEYREPDTDWKALASAVDGTSLSPAVIEGFNYTGVYLGLYVTANGGPLGAYADFDYFRYTSASGSRDAWFARE